MKNRNIKYINDWGKLSFTLVHKVMFAFWDEKAKKPVEPF